VPPAPRNVKVQRTSGRTIQVTWDEPGMPVSGYKIFYNMFALPDMNLWESIDTGPYAVAEITGLEPRTSYAVRVQAKSVSGRYGNYSETVIADSDPRREFTSMWNIYGISLGAGYRQFAWFNCYFGRLKWTFNNVFGYKFEEI
jgi:hypothetical protein